LPGRQRLPARIAHPTLAAAFIDPAIAQLKDNGANIHFNRRLHRLVFDGCKVAALEFSQDTIPVSKDDCVILAVPPAVASSLVPNLMVPDDFRGHHQRSFPHSNRRGCRCSDDRSIGRDRGVDILL